MYKCTWANNLLLPTGDVSWVLVRIGLAWTLHVPLACQMTVLGVRGPLVLQESAVHWHWEKDAEIRKDVAVVCECVKVYTTGSPDA